jgi:polar amino acid transport system substrate-binding protein
MVERIRSQWTARRNVLRGMAGLGTGVVATSAFGLSARAEAPQFRTVEKGFLTIAMSASMPETGVENGKLAGTDAKMVAAIAPRLGLTAKPAVMAWSSTIESIQAGRADIMCGDMGWTPARAQVMLLTNSIYYDGTYVTMPKNAQYTDSISVEQLRGHSLGTGLGYSYVPEMKKIPGATVKLYSDEDAAVRDMLAGRVDYVLLDDPIISYMMIQRPDLDTKMKMVPLTYNSAYPSLTGKGRIVMGMNLHNPDLFDAVNDGVKWMWKTKLNAKYLAEYGLTGAGHLTPPPYNVRIGVDRNVKGNIIGPGAHTPKDYSYLFA